MDQYLQKSAEKALLDLIDSGIVPGNGIIVGSREHILCEVYAGFEDIAGLRRVNAHTLWRMYSMTKPVTAVSVLQLAERGLLSLDDPLEKYIPEYAHMTVMDESGSEASAREAITLRHLLTMTSGLGYEIPNALTDDYGFRCRRARFAGNGWNTVEMAREFAKYPLWFQPGERFLYGFSYDVLGAVVEIVTGKTLAQYCKSEIFEPLEMTSAGFGVADEDAQRLAEGVRESPDGLISCNCVGGELVDLTQFSKPDWFSGGAGMVSTLSDYARFAMMLANGGILNGRRILGQSYIDVMRSAQLTPTQRYWYNDPTGAVCAMGPAYSYGMGVRVCADAAFEKYCKKGEWGWAGAMGTWLSIDPERDLFFVYAHQHVPSDHDRYISRLLEAVYGENPSSIRR